MKDYKAIRAICEKHSRISKTVIDDLLIYYAASRNNLERKMNKRFTTYKHVTREFKNEWINMLKAQYLAHEVFKKNGEIKKFLNHAEIQRLSREKRDFLEKQAEQPWRFSFSMITSKPAEDFFIMEDIFCNEQYTLFSPGITDLIQEQPAIVWFNLIGFNGTCWQSYGPIGAYRGFEPDDIFFFATELRPDIDEEVEILEDIENNPVPYFLLLLGSNSPLTFHQDDQLVQVRSEYDLDTINTQKLKKDFISEYNDNIYRLTLKDWGEHPHFAHAYFDENEKVIVLTAATDRGFRALVSSLNHYGYDFSEEPFIRVNPSMVFTAKSILKKDIDINEYDHLFQKVSSEEDQELIEKLNTFMAMILPDINAGRKPDIEALANEAGVDVKTARDIVQDLLDKLDNKGK